jgi:hypothetical protein
MDKDAICFVILMAPFVGSKVEESGGKRAKPKLMPLAAHGLRVLRIPGWRRRVPVGAEHLMGCDKISWRPRMPWRTLAALPVQQGSPGWEPTPWRNAENQG